MKFSQRYGFKPIRSVLQTESMDNDLRVGLWNVFYATYHKIYRSASERSRRIALVLLVTHLKLPLDLVNDVPPIHYEKALRKAFFDSQWYEVYDLLEAFANDGLYKHELPAFVNECNAVLTMELSGYRFVGTQIVPVTDEGEITNIEDALSSAAQFKGVEAHLVAALALMSDRKQPDYRNSIKESISAVEAMAQLITQDRQATLGKALAALERQGRIHPALRSAYSSLYGYTSDADGIRHAMLEEPGLTLTDAKFMLGVCSAFINYIVAKCADNYFTVDSASPNQSK